MLREFVKFLGPHGAAAGLSPELLMASAPMPMDSDRPPADAGPSVEVGDT